MNTEPTPSEPNPNQSEQDEIAKQAEKARQVEIARQVEQADRFADQLARLANARSHFLEERAKDMNIPKELSDEAFQYFETEQIEAILSRTLDLTSPWTKTGDDETTHEHFDSSGDTFIDTDNGIVQRSENTALRDDPLLEDPPIIESTTAYSINTMGRIERVVETNASELVDHAITHPVDETLNFVNGDDDNQSEDSTDGKAKSDSKPVEIDSSQAKQFVDMFGKVIDEMIEVYKGPYWNISVDTYNDGHFVIE